MGSNTADIVARLTLNAESFSATHGDAFRRFNDAAKKAGSDVKASLGSAFAEIGSRAKEALSFPSLDGKLNLNSDGLRRQAEAAKQSALAMREVANAAERAALSQDKASDEAIAYAQASAVLAQRAEENAAALSREAIALDRIQTELGQTTLAGARFAAQQGKIDSASRNNQLAMRNLGFQVSDVGASLASGSNLFVIFGQQIGQVGGALSDMTGRAGALGRFLTNPWVAALTTAGIVAGLFFDKMNDGSKAFEAAQLGADGLAQAQGALGQIFNETSGKLEKQNELLILNARLTAINLRAEAAADRAKAATLIADTDAPSWMAKGRAVVGSVLPDGIGNLVAGDYYGAKERAKQAQSAITAIRSAKNDKDRQAAGERALAFSEKADFSGLSIDRKQFQEGVVALAAGRAKDAIADLVDKSLDDGSLAAGLRKPDTKKPKTRDTSKAIAASAEFGRDAGDRLSEITSKFAGDPSRIQQVNKALNDINDIVDDLQNKKIKPPNYDALIASAQNARSVVTASLNKPFDDLIQQSREREQIDALVLQGQFAQADALQTILGLQRQMGPLNEDQRRQVLAIKEAEEARARAIDDQRRKVGLYVQAVGDVQRSFEDLFTTGSVRDLGKNLIQSFKSLQGRLLSEQLFGGLDRKIEDFVSGRTGIVSANEFLSTQTETAGDALLNFSRTVDIVTGKVADAGNATVLTAGVSSSSFANVAAFGPPAQPKADPATESLADVADRLMADASADLSDALGTTLGSFTDDIVVSGKKQIKAANDNARAVVSAADVFNFAGSQIGTNFKKLGIDLPKSLTRNFGSILQGASGGQAIGSLFGGKGGAIGGGVGAAATALLGSKAGSAISSIAGPLAIASEINQVIGDIFGFEGGPLGIFTGLLKKTKKASTTLKVENGSVVTGSAVGNSSAYKANATKLGGGVGDTLNQIADALGGDLSGPLSVSIGQRKKKFVVDPTGQGRTKGSGVLKFSDEQEAIEAALRDALSDGVVQGISDASKKILQSGQDLTKALEKATLIESVPKLLKQRLDPVGYAMDEVNSRFEKIIAALKEGGASAQQMAEAQKLYNLELADAKETTNVAADSLKDFLSSLKAGSASPYSLRDQEVSARAVLDPFLSQINRGEAVDQEKYLSAAQTFLDIERQLYGSTSKYFDALNQIQAATNSAISTIDTAAPIRTVADPFIEATATASKSTAASTSNMEQLMQQNNQLMAELIRVQGGSSAAWLDQRLGY